MSDDGSDRSLPATPIRKDRARREGQLPKSRDLTAACVLLGSALLFWGCGSGLSEVVMKFSEVQFAGEAWLQLDVESFNRHLQGWMFSIIVALLPIFLGVVIIAVSLEMTQVGFLFLPSKLEWKFQRLNPMQNLGRMFGAASWGRVFFGSVKVIVVLSVAGYLINAHSQDWMLLSHLPTVKLAETILQLMLNILFGVSGTLCVLAFLDYGFQCWKWEQDLRMSPEEMREEQKNMGPNPQILARQRTQNSSSTQPAITLSSETNAIQQVSGIHS